jgi:tetratricopeptide (TPR) repeat protein
MEEVDLDSLELFEPLSGELGSDDLKRRVARSNFLLAMQRYEPALASWQELMQHYPGYPQADIVHAQLLLRNDFWGAAQAILNRLLRERPDDLWLLLRVGDLRLEGGEVEQARELYDEVIARGDPGAQGSFRRAALAEAEGDPQLASQLYRRVLAVAHGADPMAIQSATRLLELGDEIPAPGTGPE